ncbi:MAG: hypothetical protein AAB229_11075 [Candidatus Hydrogenedentota bacterium]
MKNESLHRRIVRTIGVAIMIPVLFIAAHPEAMILDEGTYNQMGDLKVKRVTLRKKTPLTITPLTVTVAPGQSFTFAVGGGNTSKIYSSSGGRPTPGAQTFTILDNKSGATIDAAQGIYKAGSQGGVIDIVALTDGRGQRTTAKVTVTMGVVGDTTLSVVKADTEKARPKLDTAPQSPVLGVIADPAQWPGALTLPTGPASSLPFVPKSKLVANTAQPNFFWTPLAGAASYKIYISRPPLTSQNTIATATVTGSRYEFNPADARLPLVDGQSYDWTVMPKDAAGRSMIQITSGFFGSFKVSSGASATSTVSAGGYSLSNLAINDVRAASIAPEACWTREEAPDGTMAWTGVITPRPAAAWIMAKVSDSYVPLNIDPATGAFSYKIPVRADGDFVARIRVMTNVGTMVDLVPELKVIHYRHKTQVEEIRELLNKLAEAHLNNDRRALLNLIDRDYISSAEDFRDYQELDNSMRDLFNRTTTSFCRWNSEDITIVNPGKFLIVKFNWRQTINYTSLNSRRDYSTQVRLDLRRVGCKWLIREDLDRALFVKDFGSIPAPPE